MVFHVLVTFLGIIAFTFFKFLLWPSRKLQPQHSKTQIGRLSCPFEGASCFSLKPQPISLYVVSVRDLQLAVYYLRLRFMNITNAW